MKKFISYLILTAALVLTLLPLVYTITSSFKSNMEIMTNPGQLLPETFTLDNYREAWTNSNFNVGRMLWNSTYYTIFNVIVTMTLSAMGGYVFARGNFRGKKLIFTCFVSLMFIQTGGISIYAVFQVLNAVHMTSSIWALMLTKVFGVPIVNIYLVKGYIETLPRALDEAAQIDGCGFFRIFYTIILPLLKPIMATVGILAFQASWNDYLMPTIFTISLPKQQTLIVGLMAMKNSSGAATSWNLMLAGSVIALLPVLAAYAIGNKYFVSGLAAGAVKG